MTPEEKPSSAALSREELEEHLARAQGAAEVTLPGGAWREVLELALLAYGPKLCQPTPERPTTEEGEAPNRALWIRPSGRSLGKTTEQFRRFMEAWTEQGFPTTRIEFVTPEIIDLQNHLAAAQREAESIRVDLTEALTNVGRERDAVREEVRKLKAELEALRETSG